MSSSGKDQDQLRDWTFLRTLFLKLVFHLILLVMILLFVIIFNLVHRTMTRSDRSDLPHETLVSRVVYTWRCELTVQGLLRYCPRPNSGNFATDSSEET